MFQVLLCRVNNIYILHSLRYNSSKCYHCSRQTRGESVAIALSFIGARPVKEGTGRIVKYGLVPLSELNRPRIDVLASLSGIFRDSFANVVDLLDDLFETAANADEPPDMNFIRYACVHMCEIILDVTQVNTVNDLTILHSSLLPC
jgi:cobalamin biosynthesis Mg chelatase CobN